LFKLSSSFREQLAFSRSTLAMRIIIACALLFVAHALPGSPLNTTNSTNTTVKAVTFVTVETRGHAWLQKVGHFPEAVINVASGQAWPQIGIYRLKVQLLSKWLETQPAAKLVAFVDGDVFWGGCSLKKFVSAYHDIVRRTGAKIVFGAEMGCVDQDCSKVPGVPAYAQGTTPDWGQYARCPGFWTSTCATAKNCKACNDPPTPMFLNPGFIMGPAGYLWKMTLVASSRFRQWSTSSGGDQGVFAEYWLQNQKDVTLDYEAKLAMSLAYMSSNATGLDKNTGAITNMHNETLCFVHGNGPAKGHARNIAKDMGFDTETLQISGTWPPSLLQAKQSVNAVGDVVSATQQQGQLARRLARRQQPISTASEKVVEESAPQLLTAADSFRTAERARRLWWGA